MISSTLLLSFCVLHTALGFGLPANAFQLKTMIAPSITSPRQSSRTASYAYVALDDEKEALVRKLPKVNRGRMTALEVEFRQLLEGILYTNEEVESVLDSRFRTILRGIAASYYEPPVYRAFEVLYEDYIPLRIAGRLVYRKLKDVMDKSKVYQAEQLEAVTRTAGISFPDAKSCWSAFVRLTEGQKVHVDRLERMVGFRTLRFLNCDNVETAMAKLNPAGNDSLSFEELVCGLHLHGNPDDVASTSDLLSATILLDAVDELGDSLAYTSSSSSGLEKNRQKYSKRYDDMLTQFGEWKEFIPDGEGRRLDILKGCFVGSENKYVVEALRIIYVDYRALRLSGDWIFNVVSTLIAIQKRQQHRKSH